MLLIRYFTLLFPLQTSLKDLPPVLKPAIICGMDSVSGKTNSGCHILTVGNDFLDYFKKETTTTALTLIKIFVFSYEFFRPFSLSDMRAICHLISRYSLLGNCSYFVHSTASALFGFLNTFSFVVICTKQSLTIGRCRRSTKNLERFGSQVIQ